MYEEEAGEVSQSLRQREAARVRFENRNHNVEGRHAACRQKVGPEKSARARAALAQLRNTQPDGQQNDVDEFHLVAGDSPPQPSVTYEVPVPRDVIKGVPEDDGRTGGEDGAQAAMLFEVAKERRVVEEIYKEFLEVVIDTIEKLDETCRGERPISISERVKSGHARAGDETVTEYGKA